MRFCMNWILCDIQAFDFWFGVQRVTRSISPAALCSHVEGLSTSAKVPTAELARLGIGSRPLHLLASHRSMQRYSKRHIVHIWSPPYPEGTFVHVSPHIYVLSPIASLMRMSTTMTDTEVLKHLYQLVGSYRIGPDGLHERPPLMTLEQVRSYISSCNNVNGAKRIRQLLPFIAEGAASPEEAKLAIILVLPERMGGFGLPLPELNRQVIVGTGGQNETRYPDLLWEVFKLIIEYLGDEHHNRPDRFGPDAARKTHLQEAGYTVIDVTKFQTARKDELDSIAATARNIMGLPPLKQTEDFREKNEALRAALFG